jgi:hypothetical protein
LFSDLNSEMNASDWKLNQMKEYSVFCMNSTIIHLRGC